MAVLDQYHLSGAWNFRDVGALRTDDGREIRPGVLYRSSELCALDAGGQSNLRDLAITDVIDLRSQTEIAWNGPDVLPRGVTLHVASVHDDGQQTAPHEPEGVLTPELFEAALEHAYSRFPLLPTGQQALEYTIRVVSAAAGGVGSIVVQLLRLRGATVLGIASEGNHDWLAAHGVVPIAYGDGLVERLRAAAPNGIDAFIDLFGPEYLDVAVELGIPPDRIETIISRQKAAEIGAKVEGSGNASTTDVLAEMAELVASGQIEIPIAATYPLDRVRDAYAELEQRHTRGKIVLIP